jgi:hypothetical protein
MSCLRDPTTSTGRSQRQPAAKSDALTEKAKAAVPEEEMQERLSDLKREISDAKVDW